MQYGKVISYNTMKHLLKKLRDEQIRIELRSERVISILQQITYKQKPSREDIIELNKAIKILENKEENGTHKIRKRNNTKKKV